VPALTVHIPWKLNGSLTTIASKQFVKHVATEALKPDCEKVIPLILTLSITGI
jgi:hypothetical protein